MSAGQYQIYINQTPVNKLRVVRSTAFSDIYPQVSCISDDLEGTMDSIAEFARRKRVNWAKTNYEDPITKPCSAVCSLLFYE